MSKNGCCVKVGPVNILNLNCTNAINKTWYFKKVNCLHSYLYNSQIIFAECECSYCFDKLDSNFLKLVLAFVKNDFCK